MTQPPEGRSSRGTVMLLFQGVLIGVAPARAPARRGPARLWKDSPMMRPNVLTYLAGALLLGCAACSGGDAARVRPPYFAHQGWYPADKVELGESVDRMLSEATALKTPGRLCALVSPHAGHRFSGGVAAHAYRQVDPDAFDRVLLLGVDHHGLVRGASVSSLDAYSTPLGEVPLDREACDKLLKQRLFSSVPEVERAEHSLEIQLPFLQRRLKSFRLIPVAVGAASDEECGEMAKALREILTPRTLIVASTDFTHYGAGYGYVPFREDVPANLARLDQRAFDLVVKKDAAGFAKFLAETDDTICGRKPLLILLNMLPADAEGKLLKYDTSGRMLGDWTNSVSYGAIAFFRPAGGEAAPAAAAPPPEARAGGLTEPERQTLLRLARAALEDWVLRGTEPDLKALKIEPTPALREKRGAFVTLKNRGQLAGCIGHIQPTAPLYKSVIENTKNAGSRDYRFEPVAPADLAHIEIEISALTVPVEIASLDKFVVGRHGIIIQKGGQQAVFLPQVAPEQGWDRDQTLTHLCRKAVLPDDEWKKPGMKFLVFEAEVFHEKRAGGAATR